MAGRITRTVAKEKPVSPKTVLQRSAIAFVAPAVIHCASTGDSASLVECREPTRPRGPLAENSGDPAGRILDRYARAWRGKEELRLNGERTIAFWVTGASGGEFHIVLTDAAGGALYPGSPRRYDVGFELNIETLRRLDRGELNALTAMAQARGSDPVPLRLKMPASFEWTPEARAFWQPFFFHFWHREWPETVRFGDGTTRKVHGANATVFYYDRGLRSGWYQLKPGAHINADAADQVNDFASFVIATRGQFQAQLGGRERTLHEGQAVFIPAGMTHEFWADPTQYGEFVLLMFGEGA